MKPRLWKETLCRGRFRYPRTGAWHEVTQRDTREARDNLRAVVRKGRVVPATWEHGEMELSSPEEWRRNYARECFGKVVDAKLATAEDVRRGIASKVGNLLTCIECHTEDDARRLKRGGYVSPKVVRGYEDTDGANYTGTFICHVGATPTPVQWTQRPFELSSTRPNEALCLAFPLELMEATMRSDPLAGDDDEDTEGSEGNVWDDVLAALQRCGLSITDEVSSPEELLDAITADPLFKNGADATATPGTSAPMLMSAYGAAPAPRPSTGYQPTKRELDVARVVTGRMTIEQFNKKYPD